MNNPIRWLQRQFERYRAWERARAQERMRRFIEQANEPESVEQLRRENEKQYGRLILTEDGFQLLKAGQCELRVRWADVRAIRTYKLDFWGYDMICLAFEIGEHRWAEIWEGMVDFMDIAEDMQTRFSGIPADWYREVMLPAFAPNERMLWQKDPPDHS